MLRTGEQYLNAIRDGRVIYIGDERVDDATEHPAFRNIARTYAALYDMKADPANRETFAYEEDGELYSMFYLRPRSKEDLERRTACHTAITDWSYGLLGRSPDAVAGNITGITMKPELLDEEGGFGENLAAIFEHCRKDDIFATYALLPPQGARNPEFYQSRGLDIPALRVTDETEHGVILNGVKMLATGSAVADEVIVGNILPIAADRLAESITCIIPFNLAGLTLWSRPPIAARVEHEFDAPLSYRYDESDCMLVFRDVEVPWEKVLVHNNVALSRNIYIQTPSHVMANHQCNVRFRAKLRFIVGMASLITKATGAYEIPVVRETLSRLAAMEAGYSAMIDAYHEIEHGYALYNRRYMYAAVHWAMENHSDVLDIVRELMGGGVFQFPASITIMRDPELRQLFETYWSTSEGEAVERMKLFKLAWDLIGSEHASRATSYEKFFVGPAFSVRNYNFINAPWDELEGIAKSLMSSYDVPEDFLKAAAE
jgi:4-hydroxyphenylacetate 3-monooxygenase